MVPSTATAWNWVAFHGNIWSTSLVMPTTRLPLDAAWLAAEPADGLWAKVGAAVVTASELATARPMRATHARRPVLRCRIDAASLTRPPRRRAMDHAPIARVRRTPGAGVDRPTGSGARQE